MLKNTGTQSFYYCVAPAILNKWMQVLDNVEVDRSRVDGYGLDSFSSRHGQPAWSGEHMTKIRVP